MSGRRGSPLSAGRRMKMLLALGVLLACSFVVAACGSDNGGGGGGGGGAAKKITGAKVIDPNSLTSPPKGTIHFCQGKDTNGSAHQLVADFNKKFGSQGYTV